MARRPRRNHSAVFKARAALAAIRGDRTLTQLAQEHDLHPHTVTADFCVEALDEAIQRYTVPQIVNTDQCSQFTGSEFIGKLKAYEIAISMDGKGCWRDNVFVERFWKTLKQEEVCLRAYETLGEARESIRRYVAFYHQLRPHRALKGQAPDAAYFGNPPIRQAA